MAVVWHQWFDVQANVSYMLIGAHCFDALFYGLAHAAQPPGDPWS